GDIGGAAFLQAGIERFEYPPRLVDPGGRALQQHVIAARRGRNGEALFDEGEVLVEIAIELGSEAIVFKSEFEVRCKGVVCGGWQVPAQAFSAPEKGDGAPRAIHARTTLGRFGCHVCRYFVTIIPDAKAAPMAVPYASAALKMGLHRHSLRRPPARPAGPRANWC